MPGLFLSHYGRMPRSIAFESSIIRSKRKKRETLALVGGFYNQRFICMACPTRPSNKRSMGRSSRGGILVVVARCAYLFYWSMGAGLAMALPASAIEGDTHSNHVSDCLHWIYGQ